MARVAASTEFALELSPYGVAPNAGDHRSASQRPIDVVPRAVNYDSDRFYGHYGDYLS